MSYGLIYKATNLLNNKVYIGQTTMSLEKRCSIHKWHSQTPKYKGHSYFIKSMKKYGFSKFKWEVLGYCESREELNEAEIHCIDFFQSTNHVYGYNLSTGGDCGVAGIKRPPRTKEHKRKIRESLIEVNNNPEVKARRYSMIKICVDKRTQEKINKYKELVKTYNVNEIAKMENIPRNAVIYFLRKHNIKANRGLKLQFSEKYKDPEKAKLVEDLILKGVGTKEINKLTGASTVLMCKVRRNLEKRQLFEQTFTNK